MESAEEFQHTLVPGRECGFCTVCCYATHVDTPEFKKAQGEVCKHCTGRGCGIYETRPPICRTFHCGWRYTAALGDDWRPDRSGVLQVPIKEGIPEQSRYREGWNLLVLGGEASIRRAGFVELVLDLVGRGVPAFLTASGPMGAPCARVILNDTLAGAAKARDRAAALKVLLAIHRHLMALDHMTAARPEKA